MTQRPNRWLLSPAESRDRLKADHGMLGWRRVGPGKCALLLLPDTQGYNGIVMVY